ncbi:MAG TPA: M48 family metalloprotease [Allosphingosinicella sp.]|nr:M48 family metalloprotease [Allosphingosinicella sp.]
MSGRLKSIVAALLIAAAAACGDSAEDYEPSVTSAERAQAAEQHPLLLAEFGGTYDGPEARYLAGLGEKLAAAAGLGGQCTFTLVNTDVVNAFAVPGCYIYITRGLFGIVNSEAELASVLGHELGHIVANHSERRQRRGLFSGLGAMVVGVLTGSERLAGIAARAAEFYTLRYSRKQEFESDDLGIRYLVQAGYDPYAAGDMLESLGDHEAYQAMVRGDDEAQRIPAWALTHPLTGERIERAAEQAEATGHGPDALPEGEGPYLSQVDGLLWGDDPEQGFVLGRRFAHPEMGIAFEAPPGFSLANSPQAVLIDGPDGLTGQFAGGRLPPGGLEAYAAALLDELIGEAPAQVRPGEMVRTRVNGLAAVMLPVLVQTQQGAAQITVAAYAAGATDAYHFITIGPPSGGGAEAVAPLFGSFRLLSPAEARSLRPRQIEVVTVGRGETIAAMATRMAVPDHAAETFLMLNDRDPRPELRPGERVKLIVYR